MSSEGLPQAMVDGGTRLAGGRRAPGAVLLGESGREGPRVARGLGLGATTGAVDV